MANINNLTVKLELKRGIFFKLLGSKPFKYMIAILVDKFKFPFKWFLWLAVKSLKVKIGNGKYRRLPASIIE